MKMMKNLLPLFNKGFYKRISISNVSQNQIALDNQLGRFGHEIKQKILFLDPSAVFNYSFRKIFIETDLSEIQVKKALNTKFENSSWGWGIQNVVKTEGMVEINLVALCLFKLVEEKNQSWGVVAEKVKIDCIPPLSRVLDVGAGDGTITQRIHYERCCHVKAIEPDTTYLPQLQAKLGPVNVEALTLQSAVTTDKYQNAFDCVTVFKYDVPLEEKESFCAALAKAVMPTGVVIIHSVEKQRVYWSKSGKNLYLVGELLKHFESVVCEERAYGGFKDGLIKCTMPKTS